MTREEIYLRMLSGLLIAVFGMRSTQREYYKNRQQSTLIESKALEKQVDELCETITRQLDELSAQDQPGQLVFPI